LVAKDATDIAAGGEVHGNLSAAKSTSSLATNCKPGTRFPSYKVLSQSDARPWDLHHKMPSDGRFRLVVFAGDISIQAQKDQVNRLGAWLATSLLPRYSTISLSPGSDPHGGTMRFRTETDPSAVEVLLVHAAPREAIEVLRDLHEAYRPFDPKLGWDCEKVFVDGMSHHEGHGHAYEKYGVDPAVGAFVGVRPDGYVALVTGIEEENWLEMTGWLDGILQPARLPGL
jgi:phenol 2-monooxygenase (NADPH)